MFTYYNGRLQHDFARLRPDCSLDTTYLLRFSVAPTQFAQVEGGKIIVTGVFSDVNQTQARPNVVRINPDGSIDYSFNGGYGFTDTLLANYKPPSAILPGYQNRYLFTGTFTRYNSRPVKGFAFTDRNGIRDSTATFLPGINLLTSDLLFTPVLNKKTVVTGTVESEARERSFVFLVLDSNLNILQNLVQNTGQGAINGEVNKVLPAWNNSSYIIGSYSLYNQNPNHGFIKIDGTGKIDTTFKPSDNWKAANPLKVLRNKRLLVARTLLSGDTRLGILDSTGKHVGFDSAGTFVQGWIKTVYEQKDGRILIGGYFFAVGGIVKNYAARLLPDGQLDQSFSPPVTVNNIVTAFHQDEKDRILVFGTFSTAGALRLDSSGGIDTGFIIPNTPEIKKVLVSRDKSIYIQTTLTAAAIIKYDSTGIRDITFQAALQPPNGDPNMGVVQDAFMQEDGKLVLAGNFTKYNNQDSKGLVRIFPNGQIDTSFKVGLGIAGNVLNPVIYSLAPFPNGRFLTVGDFTSYQGTGRNRIAKIYYQKADVLIDSIPLRLCINGEHTVSFHCQAFEPEDSLRLQSKAVTEL